MENDDNEVGHFSCYVPMKFREATRSLIERANEIIMAYEKAGMPMSLRQLYYQMVSKNMIENNVPSYNRLGDVINNARLAGLVSWTAIEDRGRNLMGLKTYNSPHGAIKSLLANYRNDLWADQPMRPEVWVEKAALEGVVGTICNKLRVDFFACRGYNSQSEQWSAGRRLAGYISKGQTPIIFHLGDHDPSGIDMTRDNRDRLAMFAGVKVQVIRLALNMDQVDKYRLPPNPAKMTDVRYADYASRYGDESWELDALAPDVIRDLIEANVLRLRDNKLWDAALKQEIEDKFYLESVGEEDAI